MKFGNIMKSGLSLILFLALVPAFAAGVAAQDASAGGEAAEDLQTQLLKVQTKEAELQARARQLDEDLKPENIERSLAGVGSTKPEEMRELRRRQLTIERDSVRTQLQIVGTSRERLEAAIRTADARAYQESAAGTTPFTQMLEGYAGRSSLWVVGILASLIVVVGIVFAMVMVRRSSI